jgi:hypothetical protein
VPARRAHSLRSCSAQHSAQPASVEGGPSGDQPRLETCFVYVHPQPADSARRAAEGARVCAARTDGQRSPSTARSNGRCVHGLT